MREKGFTLIELMIVVAIIAIIAAVAIPNVLNARKAGNEASAVSTLRTLTTVSQTYRTRFQSYAGSLSDLEAATYVDNVLGSGVKSGYTYTYSGTTDTWSCTADPVTKGSSGDRYFFVDQSGVIRFSSTGTATSTSGAID